MQTEREALRRYIADEHTNICAVVAAKGGETLYSECWHGFEPGDAANVMSVAKSVTSLLVGIALDKRLIADVRQPVLDFFPDYAVKRGERTIRDVTIEHLLTMTAPFKYRSEPWSRICSGDDWTRAALDLLGGKAGLTGAYRYATLGLHILMGVLARASGEKTIDLANRWLFEPLGIAEHRNYEAETREEHRAFMLCKTPMENLWFADPMGVNTAGWGLTMTARDMAKLGQLCLLGGMCGDRRVVSREWIARSTAPRVDCGERYDNMRYGYLWWIPDARSPVYAAIGNGGNILYVDPVLGVTVAIAATFAGRAPDRLKLIRERILPMLGAR